MFPFKKKPTYKPSIFLIEDSHVYLQLLKKKLKQLYGETVVIKGFTESGTFLELLSKEVEVVIMDLYLDEQSNVEGIELLKKVKSRFPNTSILVLTGEENVEIAKKCFEFGADSYLVKTPESIDNIVKEIHYKIGLSNF